MTFNDIILKNLKYNLKRFFSHFFVNGFVISVLFMYGSLLFNDILNQDPAIKSSQSLIVMAAVGILIFSVIFLTYTGIFFVKSRGKEFGVYLTLGMTTGDLSRMVMRESFIVSMMSAAIGLFSGLMFSRLFYLALAKVLAIETEIFFISYKTFLLSLGIFLSIFIFNMVFISVFIRGMSVVEITKSGKTKGVSNQSPLIGIAAFIVLAASLWFFNAIVKGDDLVKEFVREQPILAPCLSMTGILSSLFFVVGSGISGIRAILKKFPNIYNKNIILLSGLSHRFLSYRVSLYSVSMLITLAVLFIGIGMSFYNYTDMTIEDYQPFDFMIERRDGLNIITEREVAEIVVENGGELDSISTLPYLDSQMYREYHDRGDLLLNYRVTGYVVKESDYNRHMGLDINLSPDELLLVYNQHGKAEEYSNFDTILAIEPLAEAIARADEFRDKDWDRAALTDTMSNITHISYNYENTRSVFGTFVNSYGNIEFASAVASVIDDVVYENIKGDQQNELILFNLKNGNQEKIYTAILQTLIDKNVENGIISKESSQNLWAGSEVDFNDKNNISELRPISKAERYEICFRANGFLLFALAFLGILFLISSCIVLYYKLVSDSDEEAEQVDLLKKIGMTVEECRTNLQIHVAVIFFAPLVLGGLLGLYLVNNFVSFTAYSGALMLRVTVMFLAVATVDVFMYLSLRKRFFRDVGI